MPVNGCRTRAKFSNTAVVPFSNCSVVVAFGYIKAPRPPPAKVPRPVPPLPREIWASS